MKKALLIVVVLTGLLAYYQSANAAFHLWEINEVFSNSDGTIQYIELTTDSPFEQQLSGHKIVTSGAGISTLEFTFTSNPNGSTTNKTLLLATERFALLTGFAPDYIIPAGFVPMIEGTINFAEGSDILTYTKGQFPLNGAQSLGGDGVPQSPSPTRFDGDTALLPNQVSPYASVDLTANNLVIPVLEAPGIGLAHVTMAINFSTLEFGLLDFFTYGPGIVPGDRPATFDGALNIPSLVFENEDFDIRLFIVQDPPLTFGNAQILSVKPILPDQEPEGLDWQLNEIFSNSDGTIQFIELFTTESGDGELSGLSLRSSGSNFPTMSFVFPNNLAGETSNRTLLLATQRFSNLTGLEPDFIIPEGFVPLPQGMVDFGNGLDSLTYSREQLPRNGTQSLNGEYLPQNASPTRFDGLSAQMPAQALPYATINEDATLLTIPVFEEPGVGVGNFSFSVNLGALQFTLLESFQYQADISPGDQPAVLNEQDLLYIPRLVFLSDQYELNLSKISDSPLTFGNPELLGVVPVPPDPGEEPEPDPDPDPLEASILRGQNTFTNVCSACHGITGEGSNLAPSLENAKSFPFENLRSFINSNMPFGNPGQCVDSGVSSCATDAANFIRNRLEIGIVIEY